MKIFSWFLALFQAPPLITIAISKNPGHLTHQDCDGGAVTLASGHFRTSSVTCSRCNAHAEFDPIYASTSFRFTREDGRERRIPLRRYRNKSIRGRLAIISAPPAH